MKEFHVLPRHSALEHVCSEACPCKPKIRQGEQTGGLPVWQHNAPHLTPPLAIVEGLMAAQPWALVLVEHVAAKSEITFRNKSGKTLRLDEDLTLAELVKMGLRVELASRDEPLPDFAFVHDPAVEVKQL